MALSYKLRDFLRPRQVIIQEAGIKTGDIVLDFGCGPGSYILPLSELVGPEGRAYALDTNLLAIQAVERLAARRQLKNVVTIKSNGPTGLPEGYFDVILLYDVFHDLAKPEEVLGELHRVLKPEGILSLSDHHLKENQILYGLTGKNLFELAKKGRFTYSFKKIQK